MQRNRKDSVLKGILQTFFAFQGDEYKHIAYYVWPHEQGARLWNLWLYVEELQLKGFEETKATFFARYVTTKSTFEKQVFEIVAPHLTLEKERDYLALLDEHLTTLCKYIHFIAES
jgi:hypothetical protein